MTAAEVTVIIPVWNGSALLSKLLEKLKSQTYSAAEVLVIDNGSEDGSAQIGEQHGARVIRMGSNTGFSRAANRGIQESRTRWLAIVNTDLEPQPDWLERLMQAAQADGVWFAAPKLLSASHRDRIDGTWDALCRGGCPWRVGYGRLDGPEFSNQRTIWFAPGTASLYRAELFEKVGLFDESFESYLEDVDLGVRCALKNYRGLYVPEAVAFHVGSATLGRWHAEIVRRTARNQLALVAKYYPNRLLIRYAWSILVAQTLWGMVSARHGAGWSFLLGKWEGLRSFRVYRALKHSEILDSERLAAVLDECEREIHNVQRKTGFDLYWRLYFVLTAGGAN